MPIPTLSRNTWYLIASKEGGGIIQNTEAMKVPTGVVIRNTTLVNGPNNVSESMVFIPGAGLCKSDKDGFFDVCATSLNEAVH